MGLLLFLGKMFAMFLNRTFSLVLLFALLYTSCFDQHGPIFRKPCCQTAAVQLQVGNGNLFIPNAFTPNGDGVNDLFKIYGDDNIQEIVYFRIIGNLGRVIFSAESFVPGYDLSQQWNGRHRDQVYVGQFKYEVEALSTDGVRQSFSGKACSLSCYGKSLVLNADHLDKCVFGSQHNNRGGLDPNLPRLEPHPDSCD